MVTSMMFRFARQGLVGSPGLMEKRLAEDRKRNAYFHDPVEKLKCQFCE